MPVMSLRVECVTISSLRMPAVILKRFWFYIRYSNALFSLNAYFSFRATKLLATPGGPNRKILSPAMAANKERAMVCSFSNTPSLRASRSLWIRGLIELMFFQFECKNKNKLRMKKNKTESHYREFVCFPFNIVNSRFLLFYSLWQELYFKELKDAFLEDKTLILTYS